MTWSIGMASPEYYTRERSVEFVQF